MFNANISLGRCISTHCKKNMNSIQKKTKGSLNCIEKECKTENQNLVKCKISHCKLLNKVPKSIKKKVMEKLKAKN